MPDLVIGGRRPSPQRTVRAVVIGCALIAAAFVVAWFIYRRAVSYDVPEVSIAPSPLATVRDAPGAPPHLDYGSSNLGFAGGIAVVRASGDAVAIGAAHGRLLGGAVAAVAAQFAPSIEQSVGEGGMLGGLTRDMRIAWQHRFVDDGLAESHRRGLSALAAGAGASGAPVSYSDLVRQQAALDVGVAASWTDESALRQLTRAMTFVAPQGASVPGRLWIGRTFALPGLADGGDEVAAHPVVSFVRPSDGIAWASVGWPGLAGVVTGINAEGLVVTVNPARTRDVRATRAARPAALLARDVLESCKSIDEAAKLVDSVPTLGAAVLVIADGKTGAWAVLERTPTRLVVTRTPTRPAIGSVLAAPAFADDPENDRARRVLPTPMRVERANRLLRTPPADAVAAVTVLRDARTAEGGPLPSGHRGAVDDAAASHVVLIDPGAMTLWVADGTASGRFRAFDLRHELRGEGERPAPPPDVSADADADPDVLRSLRVARGELRAARRAASDGAWQRADELAQRALARAPTLPEALELAGRLARQRGDRASAIERWRRWLENGPDDPGAEEEIRALVGP
jgi:isopenicillin-N N-acyltransferase like protein